MSLIQQAASVFLTRAPDSTEIFLVRRSEKLRFFGGFYAFPGGKLGREDARDPSHWEDPEHAVALRRMAAARELFEETGVLVARRKDGSYPASGEDLDGLRRDLLVGEITFFQILDRLEVCVHDDDFHLIGEITTPPFASVRFATTFFLAMLPPNQEPTVWDGELTEGHWGTADFVLNQWARGQWLVSPPMVATLQVLRNHRIDLAPEKIGPYLRELEKGRVHPIFYAPDVQLIPLHTQALPPSTHTNAYLVGSGPRYLLDPGPDSPEEQERLFEVLDKHSKEGRPLTAVVLTHHHPDHVGAAMACARRYQVPIWAHSLTATQLKGKVTVDREIDEGERLEMGNAPDGSGPWNLQAIHTPGHAMGHLAFYESHYGLLFAGDMVSTVTSVVIAPPDGDLAVYIRSLEKLLTYPTRLLLPAHGSPTARPAKTLEDCIQHREKRERQLIEILERMPRTITDLGPELYKGLPEKLMKFAQMQLLAGLQKLRNEGQAEVVGDEKHGTWRLRQH